MLETPRYHVIRDDREKEGKGWIFDESEKCSGTTVQRLPTGDYTIEGYETEIIIERKGDINEFKTNLFKDYERFTHKLWRMRTFRRAIVVLEFEFSDIMNYPRSSGLSDRVIDQIEVTGSLLRKRFMAVEAKYPYVHFEFVGKYGKVYAGGLFHQIMESLPVAELV